LNCKFRQWTKFFLIIRSISFEFSTIFGRRVDAVFYFWFKHLQLVWKFHRNSKSGKGPTCHHPRPPTCACPCRATRVTACHAVSSPQTVPCHRVRPSRRQPLPTHRYSVEKPSRSHPRSHSTPNVRLHPCSAPRSLLAPPSATQGRRR
jgi:hypothetical protein